MLLHASLLGTCYSLWLGMPFPLFCLMSFQAAGVTPLGELVILTLSCSQKSLRGEHCISVLVFLCPVSKPTVTLLHPALCPGRLTHTDCIPLGSANEKPLLGLEG